MVAGTHHCRAITRWRATTSTPRQRYCATTRVDVDLHRAPGATAGKRRAALITAELLAHAMAGRARGPTEYDRSLCDAGKGGQDGGSGGGGCRTARCRGQQQPKHRSARNSLAASASNLGALAPAAGGDSCWAQPVPPFREHWQARGRLARDGACPWGLADGFDLGGSGWDSARLVPRPVSPSHASPGLARRPAGGRRSFRGGEGVPRCGACAAGSGARTHHVSRVHRFGFSAAARIGGHRAGSLTLNAFVPPPPAPAPGGAPATSAISPSRREPMYRQDPLSR